MSCNCPKGANKYGGIPRPPLSYKAGGKSPKASMSCGQVKRSSRPGKKIMKLYCVDGKKKLVHAGAKGYGHNYSAAARKSFKARHKCSTAKPGTAKHLACTELWAGKGGSKKSSPKGRKGKYNMGGPTDPPYTASASTTGVAMPNPNIVTPIASEYRPLINIPTASEKKHNEARSDAAFRIGKYKPVVTYRGREWTQIPVSDPYHPEHSKYMDDLKITDPVSWIKATNPNLAKTARAYGGPRKYAVGGPYLNINPYNPEGYSDVEAQLKGSTMGTGEMGQSIQKKIKRRQTGRNIGSTAYGVLEGLVDTVSFGLTDSLTDKGYEALAGLGRGQTDVQKLQSDRYRVGGQAVGATVGSVVTGGSATGSAIGTTDWGDLANEGPKGLQTGLDVAGTVAGVAVGNTSSLGNNMGALSGTAVGDISSSLGNASSFGGTGTGFENLMGAYAPNLQEGLGAVQGNSGTFSDFKTAAEATGEKGNFLQYLGKVAKENPEMLQKLMNMMGSSTSYRYGGPIKMSHGGPHNPPSGQKPGILHMGNDPEYFNNRAVFNDNPKANEIIRKKIYEGTHGWNPKTKALVKLPEALEKQVQEGIDPLTKAQSTREYTESGIGRKRGFYEEKGKEYLETLPEDQREAVKDNAYRQRRDLVAEEQVKMYQNPLTYAPAALYTAGMAGPLLSGARAGLGAAMRAPLTIGSTTVPGATIGNLATAGFASDFLANRASQIPGQIGRGEYSDAAFNTATGALDLAGMGLGTKALQGAKGLYSGAKNLGKRFPNAHKYNPWAFKPSSEAAYRMIGEKGYLDALETGVIRPRTPKYSFEQQKYKDAYYNIGYPQDLNWGLSQKYKTGYSGPYMAEVLPGKKFPTPFQKAYPEINANTGYSVTKPGEHLSIDSPNVKFYKEHWLQGYKPVTTPRANPSLVKKPFKSDIDWRNWVKYTDDFDNNPDVIRHLNKIEETTKANGTWMKNPDGSPFKGTKEQFVVQQSDNFKKAFGKSKLLNPDGSPTMQYHGTAKEFNIFDPAKFQLGDSGYSGLGIYTSPSKVGAESYALSSAKFHTGKIKPTVMELYGLGKNPVRGHELPEGTSLFNFHRPRDYAGPVPLEKQLLDHDVAIRTQRGGTRIAPDYDSYENVFPTNTQLKSTKGNILFDMSNPNIYKATIPAVGLGAGYGLLQNNQPEGFASGGPVSYYQGGLRRWFKEKWVDVKTGKPCGRSGKEKSERPYPYCRPSRKVSSKTPATSKNPKAKSRATQKKGPGRVKPISKK
jgi:hypothetical protein